MKLKYNSSDAVFQIFYAHVDNFSLSLHFFSVSVIVQCSVTCGRGYQTRFIKCAEKVCIILYVLCLLKSSKMSIPNN